jgi:16S rRNA (cytidine1402-2'-O)-methyltransferase
VASTVTARTNRSGILWLVATPIGNLADLTPRATEILGSVGLVCCEDTRRTGKLLHLAGITAPPMAVCNEHTEHDLIDRVLDSLGAGDDVAIVSDAGTPGISDPGERIVAAAVAAGATITPVPGACAAVAGLIASGLPTGRWVMEGFVPRSGPERRKRIEEIAAEQRTVVLYEAPHRLARTVSDLADACGADRRVTIARELTKLHEEFIHGALGTIDIGEPRGEYVIVLDGRHVDRTPPDDDIIRAAVDAEIAAGASRRDAAATVAKRLGVPRRVTYDLTIGNRSISEPSE